MRTAGHDLGGRETGMVLHPLRLAGAQPKPGTTKLREGSMNYTIYIIDRAGQYHVEHYQTNEERNQASDRWESMGCDVYRDIAQAARAAIR